MGEKIERPENWDDMVEKYYQGFERETKKVLEKRGATTPEQLPELTKKVLKEQAARRGAEFQTLTEEQRTTIIHEPKDPKTIALREELNKEIREFAKTRIGQQTAAQSEDLKGRVTMGAAPEGKKGSK